MVNRDKSSLSYARLTLLVLAGTAGCATPDRPVAIRPGAFGPASKPALGGPPGYVVSGDLAAAGFHPLRAGETVSAALKETLGAAGRTGPLTVALVRRGPEGMTRELIDVGRSLELKDPKQDAVLRPGDELVLPSVTVPSGLERPPVSHSPTPN